MDIESIFMDLEDELYSKIRIVERSRKNRTRGIHSNRNPTSFKEEKDYIVTNKELCNKRQAQPAAQADGQGVECESRNAVSVFRLK